MNSLINVCGTKIKVQGRLLRIARLDGDGYSFLDDPEAVLEGLRNCGVRIDLFTFLQRLPETSPKYRYPMEWDNLAVLPVSTFDHWWNCQILSYPRNRARQAQKRGVTIREVPFDDELVRGIWEVYNECPVRQGRPFRHYGMDLQTVHKVEATHLERSIFIGAFLGDKLIGFVKLVHDETRTQAELMNIVSMVQHKEKCPTNALIAQAVRSCADRAIPFLLYQRFSYRNKRPDGISKFKEVNGFQRVDLPRYYVPLTRLGSVAFRLGLHHGLVDHFPEPVVAKTPRAAERVVQPQAPGLDGSFLEEKTMPGIVGLITKMPRERAERELLRMVEALRHESFYATGTWIDESLGVYVGWVARKDSFSDGMPLCNERGDTSPCLFRGGVPRAGNRSPSQGAGACGRGRGTLLSRPPL